MILSLCCFLCHLENTENSPPHSRLVGKHSLFELFCHHFGDLDIPCFGSFFVKYGKGGVSSSSEGDNWWHPWLGGGFQSMFYFHPYYGEDPYFDEHIFQMGWFNHQPDDLAPTSWGEIIVGSLFRWRWSWRLELPPEPQDASHHQGWHSMFSRESRTKPLFVNVQPLLRRKWLIPRFFEIHRDDFWA